MNATYKMLAEFAQTWGLLYFVAIFVAVVAYTWWHAKTALAALPIVWDEGENATRTSAQIAEHLKDGLSGSAYAMTTIGDVSAAIAGAPVKVEATYSTPFLAHACMEPMNCTVKYTPERAECWVATQNGEASHALACPWLPRGFRRRSRGESARSLRPCGHRCKGELNCGRASG